MARVRAISTEQFISGNDSPTFEFQEDQPLELAPSDPPPPAPPAERHQHEWSQEMTDAGVAVYRCKGCHILGAGPPSLAKKRSALSGGGF